MSTHDARLSAKVRRVPRQARSRATIEAIVQAGAAVLSARGWFGFTTNEVIDVAGVGTATLYQYFPNKDALVAAVGRQHFDHALEELRRSVSGRSGLRHLVDDFVQGMVAVHSIDPWLHRALLDSPAPAESRAARAAFQAEYLSRCEAVVRAFRGGPKGAADAAVVQVLSSAVESVIYNANRNGTPRMPELKRELVALVTGYLGATIRSPGEVLAFAAHA
ncbi:TetR/AcrR family transcriptional regulator [Inquilinus sp. Marseille-Q2685]|uniref:TetR/AcrR family transcriptional regulator n=1 Tax=Inquilinus sp. Marseille-Q2685 TaxID=2866581 RepID=UPI001CE3EA50|nr:TetR/AcrR family transcriptional regulator [Inquilinus sp. Marseille-Q2685]